VLIVVRHGQTEVNARGQLLGRTDPPLNATGREQAAAVAATLAPLSKTTRVICSPLRRTRETAAIIAPEAKVVIDERWIELNYGAFEGKPVMDITMEEWDRWRSDPDFAPEGGETLRSLGLRVEEACLELLEDGIDEDVIVVTHVSPVKAAVVWALCVGDEATWRTYVAPASITRITNRRHGPVLVSFNETPWSVAAKVAQKDD
jgi:broad specificity phosphatase PhoE